MPVVAAVCVMLVLQSAQGHSLLENARRNGGTATVIINIESGPHSMSDVATVSTVILRGIVRRVTTRLSDDEENVMTQFEITPERVYKGTVAPVAQAPGRTTPLTVERTGGELSINGLRLRTVVDVFPETESLRDGEEAFLFLSPGPSKGVYHLTDGPFGAYRIAAGRVTAMTHETAARRGEQPQPLEEFERRVLDSIRR